MLEIYLDNLYSTYLGPEHHCGFHSFRYFFQNLATVKATGEVYANVRKVLEWKNGLLRSKVFGQGKQH